MVFGSHVLPDFRLPHLVVNLPHRWNNLRAYDASTRLFVMRDLLIITTYCETTVKEWFPIQRKMLDKYTRDYDLAVCLHEVNTTEAFSGIEVLGEWEGDLLEALPSMFEKALETFRSRKYKNYLLLDSDCFPVKHGWLDGLIEATKGYEYAAPVRTENLDTFPHPCALFIKGSSVQNDWWRFRRGLAKKSLLGADVKDIGADFTIATDKQVFFPLVRTNFVNVHPILGAIYGDTFYHHGGGSRMPFFRSGNYWNKVSPSHYKSGQICYKFLAKNPVKFVKLLRGADSLETISDLRNFAAVNW